MNTFFGYGNLGADLWFVGMEEGGGNSEVEIQNRLNIWASRGRREVEDAAEFHQAIGRADLFYGDGKIQRTWEQLIRVIFKIQGRRATQSQMRLFQNNCFGRSWGCGGFLELLPLPSPHSGVWNYGRGQGDPPRRWTNIDFLRSRPAYQEKLRDSRCDRLRKLITFHRPKAVIFYGVTNKRYLSAVCDATFKNPGRPEAVDGTNYMLLVHPTYRFGPTAAIYSSAGKSLRRKGVRC